MTGKLITLPARVWLQSARLLTRAAGGVVGRAVSLAGQAIGAASPDGSGREQPAPAATPQPEPSPAREPSPSRPVRAVTPVRPPAPEPAAPPTDTRPAPEPAHVSEQPELVREEAEPGAEDGAGATINVLEPWNGYARMNAREIIDRARQANAAELAAVRLYESRHRSRQTVLAAVDRQLKLGNGADPA